MKETIEAKHCTKLRQLVQLDHACTHRNRVKLETNSMPENYVVGRKIEVESIVSTCDWFYLPVYGMGTVDQEKPLWAKLVATSTNCMDMCVSTFCH